MRILYLAIFSAVLASCGDSSDVDYARADELSRIQCDDLLHAGGIDKPKRRVFCNCLVEKIAQSFNAEDHELNARYVIATIDGSSNSERAALMGMSPDDYIKLGQRFAQLGVPAGQECKALIE